MPSSNLLHQARQAPTGSPLTCFRAPGLAVKMLRLAERDGELPLSPAGQGHFFLVMEGQVRYREEGRPPSLLSIGEGWFQPGDRSAHLSSSSPSLALLLSTPTPDREPRLLPLATRLESRWIPLPLGVFHNESVRAEARRLHPLKPGRRHLQLEPLPHPTVHILLLGRAHLPPSEVSLERGGFLEIPAGQSLSLLPLSTVHLLTLEVLKGGSARASSLEGPERKGFSPFLK